MQINTRLVDVLAIYRSELLERTVPFWLSHAVDHIQVLERLTTTGRP